jgi:DDB1- and CUL4-associated factor 11
MSEAATGGDGSEGPTELRLSNLSLRQLRRLFLLADGGRRSISFRVLEHNDEEEDDDDEENWTGSYMTGPAVGWRRPQITEPQKPGLELLMSGEFGHIGRKMKSKKYRRNVSRRIFDRATSARGLMHKEDLASVSKFHDSMASFVPSYITL